MNHDVELVWNEVECSNLITKWNITTEHPTPTEALTTRKDV